MIRSKLANRILKAYQHGGRLDKPPDANISNFINSLSGGYNNIQSDRLVNNQSDELKKIQAIEEAERLKHVEAMQQPKDKIELPVGTRMGNLAMPNLTNIRNNEQLESYGRMALPKIVAEELGYAAAFGVAGRALKGSYNVGKGIGNIAKKEYKYISNKPNYLKNINEYLEHNNYSKINNINDFNSLPKNIKEDFINRQYTFTRGVKNINKKQNNIKALHQYDKKITGKGGEWSGKGVYASNTFELSKAFAASREGGVVADLKNIKLIEKNIKENNTIKKIIQSWQDDITPAVSKDFNKMKQANILKNKGTDWREYKSSKDHHEFIIRPESFNDYKILKIKKIKPTSIKADNMYRIKKGTNLGERDLNYAQPFVLEDVKVLDFIKNILKKNNK